MKEVIDMILIQLKDRMRSVTALNDIFSFLGCKKLKHLNDNELKACAANLASKYLEDISEDEFPTEILVLRDQLQNSISSINFEEMTPLDLLNLIQERELTDTFPNVCIALRIYLTLPTTSASCERSFSKLKIIKNYLRATMTQDRLKNLAILSIESEEANLINYDDAINSFSERKSRKINL
ncbi:hypothetical protein RI129_007269 [Pyrocoelia pectoralis]|uniref:HAT C-terminal dimerisation domain-containing protein n=1 Tax=Pyrocoelia pectoralis TaxID=417401 RepID=A0AAN7VG86_9COLE